jgi:hypothetical protein
MGRGERLGEGRGEPPLKRKTKQTEGINVKVMINLFLKICEYKEKRRLPS